ncbi:MAG: HIT domain-containing protein [Patescibacteria group bacterium]
MSECIFCQIADKKKPADILFENKELVVLKDINPKARIHFLIVPKKHISSVQEMKEGDRELFGSLILAARDQARNENLTGYKLLFNVGRDAGQIIEHVHLHLLAD